MKSNLRQNNGSHGRVEGDSWLEIVRQQVGSLNFGVVQIIVHAGRVVQIETTEKIRLEHPIAASTSQV